ncbi:Gustatory receptor 105a, partial [Halyomorpha halys]
MTDPRLNAIFTVPRVLGTFPMDKTFLLSKTWLTYTVIFQAINVHLVIRGVSYYILKFSIHTARHMEVLEALSCTGALLSVSCNIFFMVRLILIRKNVLQLLEKISEALLKYNNFPKIRFRFIYSSIFFLLIPVSVLILSGGSNLTFYSIELIFMVYFSCTSTFSIVCQFWDLMQVLVTLVRNTNVYEECSINILEQLTSMAESMNDIYGPYLLFMIGSIMFRLVAYCYSLLLPIFPGMLANNAMLVIYSTMCMVSLVAVAYSCLNFSHQIDEFNNKLLWKMLNDKTGRYIENEKFNFHFTAYKAIKFTACGFFNMDYSLISSMISVCTTYLVIVLQYGKSS